MAWLGLPEPGARPQGPQALGHLCALLVWPCAPTQALCYTGQPVAADGDTPRRVRVLTKLPVKAVQCPELSPAAAGGGRLGGVEAGEKPSSFGSPNLLQRGGKSEAAGLFLGTQLQPGRSGASPG